MKKYSEREKIERELLQELVRFFETEYDFDIELGLACDIRISRGKKAYNIFLDVKKEGAI